MTVAAARMYWCNISIHKLHPFPEKIGLGSADFLRSGTGYIEIDMFVLLLICCGFQSEFFTEKFNHDFSHDFLHSEKPLLPSKKLEGQKYRTFFALWRRVKSEPNRSPRGVIFTCRNFSDFAARGC